MRRRSGLVTLGDLVHSPTANENAQQPEARILEQIFNFFPRTYRKVKSPSNQPCFNKGVSSALSQRSITVRSKQDLVPYTFTRPPWKFRDDLVDLQIIFQQAITTEVSLSALLLKHAYCLNPDFRIMKIMFRRKWNWLFQLFQRLINGAWSTDPTNEDVSSHLPGKTLQE